MVVVPARKAIQAGLVVEIVVGLLATKTPVPVVILYCEIWFDPLSTTKRNFPEDVTAIALGARPAGIAPTEVRLPSGTVPLVGQVADCLTHTAKPLTVFDPELATYRKFPSGVRVRAAGVVPAW